MSSLMFDQPQRLFQIVKDPMRISLKKKKLKIAAVSSKSEIMALREGCGKSKWKFKMAFAIRRPAPPPLMAQISRH